MKYWKVWKELTWIVALAFIPRPKRNWLTSFAVSKKFVAKGGSSVDHLSEKLEMLDELGLLRQRGEKNNGRGRFWARTELGHHILVLLQAALSVPARLTPCEWSRLDKLLRENIAKTETVFRLCRTIEKVIALRLLEEGPLSGRQIANGISWICGPGQGGKKPYWTWLCPLQKIGLVTVENHVAFLTDEGRACLEFLRQALDVDKVSATSPWQAWDIVNPEHWGKEAPRGARRSQQTTVGTKLAVVRRRIRENAAPPRELCSVFFYQDLWPCAALAEAQHGVVLKEVLAAYGSPQQRKRNGDEITRRFTTLVEWGYVIRDDATWRLTDKGSEMLQAFQLLLHERTFVVAAFQGREQAIGNAAMRLAIGAVLLRRGTLQIPTLVASVHHVLAHSMGVREVQNILSFLEARGAVNRSNSEVRLGKLLQNAIEKLRSLLKPEEVNTDGLEEVFLGDPDTQAVVGLFAELTGVDPSKPSLSGFVHSGDTASALERFRNL